MTDHGDADDDDPQLGGLRSIWLSMPDEDPPARGLAELMAAARVKADEMAQPSLFQRVVAMLKRPPVLALATVMVLVAGVVLVGNRREKIDTAPVATQENFERDTTGAPAAPVATPPEDPAAGSAVGRDTLDVEAKPDKVGGQGKAEIAAPAPRPRGTTQQTAAEKTANKGVATTTATHTAKKKAPPRGDDADGIGDLAKEQDERREITTETAKPAKTGEKLQLAEPEAPPPEETAVRGTATATADPQAMADSEGGAAKSKQPQNVAQLHAQARTAASRNDCAAVKVMVQRIAKQDPAYYRSNVAKDAAITKCVGTAAYQ